MDGCTLSMCSATRCAGACSNCWPTGEQSSTGALTAVVRAEFGISQPAVSQHLKVLRENGFTSVRPEDSAGCTRWTAMHCVTSTSGSIRFRRFWRPHLDALATEVARGKRERRTQGENMTDIDVDHQINAVARSVGARTIDTGEAQSSPSASPTTRIPKTCGTPSPTSSAFRAG